MYLKELEYRISSNNSPPSINCPPRIITPPPFRNIQNNCLPQIFALLPLSSRYLLLFLFPPCQVKVQCDPA